MKLVFYATYPEDNKEYYFYNMSIPPEVHRNVHSKDMLKFLRVRKEATVTEAYGGQEIKFVISTENLGGEYNKLLIYRDVQYVINTLEAICLFIERQSDSYITKEIIHNLVEVIFADEEISCHLLPHQIFHVLDLYLQEIINNLSFETDDNRIIMFIKDIPVNGYSWDKVINDEDEMVREIRKMKGDLLKQLFTNKLIPDSRNIMFLSLKDGVAAFNKRVEEKGGYK